MTPIGWRSSSSTSPGRSLGDDLALDPAGPLGGVVEVVGRSLDLAPGLVERLALLLGEDPGEVLGVVPDPGRDAMQVAGPLDRRDGLPGPLGLVGELDRLAGILGRRVRDLGHDLPGGRVLDGQRLAALRGRRAAR